MVHVAHGTVEVNGVEWMRIHERVAGHDHARDPEKQNFGRGDQIIGGIERGQIGRALVGPAEGRNGEEPGREPGIEHVFVLSYLAAAFLAGSDVSATHDLTPALVAVPDGNAVTPP